MTDKLFLGVPILNRADLLDDCLARVDRPAEILVINNNSIDRDFRRQVEEIAGRYGAEVRNQERNLGVAASWNRIIQWGMGLGYGRIAIGSNDTLLDPGSLAALERLPPPEEDETGIWHLCGWNFFAINAWVISKVGWFDENFYPAYKEDDDYAYRCRLAGVPRKNLPGAAGTHLLSQTIFSDPEYARLNQDTHCNWNQNHYLMKWGGDYGRETFTTPYDKPERDLRWWPDPCDTIAIRDWDNSRRERAAKVCGSSMVEDAARTTVQSLAEIYERYTAPPGVQGCGDKGTVHSYIETYARLLEPYRATATQVVEIGIGNGLSLRMWEQYFRGAIVRGVDLCDRPTDGKCDLRPMIACGLHRIHLFDAASREAVEAHFGGEMFDVVIEDASHSVEQQVAIYRNFRPHLSPGGIYVIEDVQNLDATRNVFEGLDPGKSIEILDLRCRKGRYDDVLVVVRDG